MNKHVPGIGHVPGAKCLVAVSVGPMEKQRLSRLQDVAERFFGAGAIIKHIKEGDNGRIVQLVKRVGPGWSCKGCDFNWSVMLQDKIIWEVVPIDSKGPFISEFRTCDVYVGIFEQRDLIPLGNDTVFDGTEEDKKLLIEDPTPATVDGTEHLTTKDL